MNKKLQTMLKCRVSHLARSLSGSRQNDQSGQSLVEFAIIVPILLLMLLGVFEVGWALRGYLTLVNVNREATRFSARGLYLDFDEKTDPAKVGYDQVISHTIDSLSGQLEMDITGANPNGTEFISYYNVVPGDFNCLGDASCTNFDCSRFAYENRNDANFVPGDNLHTVEYPVLIPPAGVHPDLPSYYNQVLSLTNTIPISSYFFAQGATNIYSRIDPGQQVVELRSKMNQHNCELVKKNLAPTNNSYVVVENVYFQPQLVGFPFITAFVPDPLPFYTHTVMRVTDNIRETTQETAESCSLYPIMIPASKVSGISQGDSVDITIENSHDVPGNFGYVQWKSDEPPHDGPQRYGIPDNLQNPGNVATDFLEPGSSPPDTLLNIGDWVAANPGTHASNEVKTALSGLQATQTEMRMPVWFDSDCNPGGGGCSSATGSGSTAKYKIQTFVVMKLTAVDYTGNPKKLTFEFSHYDPYVCEGDDRP